MGKAWGPRLFTILLALFFLPLFARAQSPEQRRNLLERIAHLQGNPTFSVIAARIQTGIDVDFAYRQLDTLLTTGYGDMFWMYGATGLILTTGERMRGDYYNRIIQRWHDLVFYRGDTENHFLMYYGSLYLMTQLLPKKNADWWFTGQSSDEIRKQSADYLEHWIDDVGKNGQIEFDSPRYHYYFITPLVLLASYSHEQQGLFHNVLDALLADYAVEYLNGNYCGAHSRVSDQAALNPRDAESTTYGEYFFEDSVKHLNPDLAFLVLANYHLPKIIRDIANDRTVSYEHVELKRGRTTLRYSSERNKPVIKYDWITPHYALGSMQGGLIQPIQQQSWSLVMNRDMKHNVITGLHPNIDKKELGMFFPEQPSFGLRKIGSVKGGYPNENKWVGGSPYEKIYQRKNELVAQCQIPENAYPKHIDLYIPKEDLTVDSSGGWIRLRYDSMLVGIYMLSPYSILDEGQNYRIRSVAKVSGYHVIASHLSEMSLSGFRTLCAKSDWRDVRRHAYRGSKKWLYRSKFMESRKGSGTIVLRAKGERQTLDLRQSR